MAGINALLCKRFKVADVDVREKNVQGMCSSVRSPAP